MSTTSAETESVANTVFVQSPIIRVPRTKTVGVKTGRKKAVGGYDFMRTVAQENAGQTFTHSTGPVGGIHRARTADSVGLQEMYRLAEGLPHLRPSDFTIVGQKMPPIPLYHLQRRIATAPDSRIYCGGEGGGCSLPENDTRRRYRDPLYSLLKKKSPPQGVDSSDGELPKVCSVCYTTARSAEKKNEKRAKAAELQRKKRWTKKEKVREAVGREFCEEFSAFCTNRVDCPVADMLPLFLDSLDNKFEIVKQKS